MKTANRYMDKQPSTGGRPRLALNNEGRHLVEMLAGLMCTEEEIADKLDVSLDTLKNETNGATFSECIIKGKSKGKVSLRRFQFHLAERNASMAIFLGKNILGQTDEPNKTERAEEVAQAAAAAVREFVRLTSPKAEDVAELFTEEAEEQGEG